MKARKCRWFALCTRPADGNVAHPILGQVPTCARCAKSLGLVLVSDQALDPPGYAARVAELEAEGLTTSDAQGVADVEFGM